MEILTASIAGTIGLSLIGIAVMSMLARGAIEKQRFAVGEFVYYVDESKFYKPGFNTVCKICNNELLCDYDVYKVMFLDGTIAFVHRSSIRKCEKQNFSLQVLKDHEYD